MTLVAQDTLAKARLFVRQARSTSPNDREALVANFEAAVVFARSVTFHLQSQLARATGFEDWYKQVQAALRADPLAKFLLEQRNYVLKVGPAPVRRVINVYVVESMQVSATVSARVVRGQPWYRRSFKILVEDLVSPLREWVALRRQQAVQRAQLGDQPQVTAAPPTHEIFFQEDPWSGVPALDLLEQQLNTLSRIVNEAANEFPQPQR